MVVNYRQRVREVGVEEHGVVGVTAERGVGHGRESSFFISKSLLKYHQFGCDILIIYCSPNGATTLLFLNLLGTTSRRMRVHTSYWCSKLLMDSTHATQAAR